jgi:hypothetical protein
MKAYIVTEGELGRSLLQRLLPADLTEAVAVVTASGGSGAVSMARSLLATRQSPVALVLDADSISPDFVRERSRGLRELLRSVSSGPDSEVFLAVPELEGIFFQAPNLLERVLGLTIPETLAILAEARPKDALDRLFAQHQSIKTVPELLSALTPCDDEELRATKPIANLNEFLRHALHEANAA